MFRRDFLKASLCLAGYTVVSASYLERAAAATGLPYQSLLKALPPGSAHLVRPHESKYAAYNVAFNKRTQQDPQLRLLPLNASAVAIAVGWLSANQIPFAVRCGGHSYEGFSQSKSFVIDLRLMDAVDLDLVNDRAFVGGGAALGQVYTRVGQLGRAIGAGSCSTVGIGGHSTGGGFGFLTRAYGLACDQIESFEIVTADGRVQTASAGENPDLFWACRGGGGGSFGVITKFVFKMHAVRRLAVFGLGWTMPTASAAKVLAFWEEWIDRAPTEITSVMRASRDPHTGLAALRLVGQSLDPDRLNTALEDFEKTRPQTPIKIEIKDFIGATNHFAGTHAYTSTYMAGKSDYVKTPMGEAGFAELCRQLQSLPAGAAVVMMDSYGGAVKEMAPDACAFAHRDAIFGMQYAAYWTQADENAMRMHGLNQVHQAMRTYVSGGAYVNYPDADLSDYRTAYWGANLPRLQNIKASVDPQNLFRHRQSV